MQRSHPITILHMICINVASERAAIAPFSCIASSQLIHYILHICAVALGVLKQALGKLKDVTVFDNVFIVCLCQ